VFAVDCSRHVPKDKATGVPAFFCALDAAMAASPRGDLTVIFDVRKFGRANFDVTTALSLVSGLNQGYPERLGTAYIYGGPRIFGALWRAVSVLLDARTRSKVCFVTSPEELTRAVGAHCLPVSMGGSNTGLDGHLQSWVLDGTHPYMDTSE
jgi:CRAL/TRIO domain